MGKFAEQLTSLRKQAGMSQEDLAEKLQLTRQTISKWETGASTPDLELLVQLAEVFDVSVDSLLGVKKPDKKSAEKTSFLTIFCIFQLTIFVAGVALYISGAWMLVKFGNYNPLMDYACLVVIFLPPLIILGIGIARYRDWRKTKK